MYELARDLRRRALALHHRAFRLCRWRSRESGLARGARQMFGAKGQYERLSGSGDPTNDAVPFAQAARHLLLVQVHHGECSTLLRRRLRFQRQRDLSTPNLGKQQRTQAWGNGQGAASGGAPQPKTLPVRFHFSRSWGLPRRPAHQTEKPEDSLVFVEHCAIDDDERSWVFIAQARQGSHPAPVRA